MSIATVLELAMPWVPHDPDSAAPTRPADRLTRLYEREAVALRADDHMVYMGRIICGFRIQCDWPCCVLYGPKRSVSFVNGTI